MTTDSTTVASKPSYRQIRDRVECDAYEGAVETKLLNGTLSAAEMAEAVFTDDFVGFETIPSSIGCALIARHPAAFVRTIGDPAAFLEQYFYPAVARTYLQGDVFPVLLADPAARQKFVETYFVAHGNVRDAITLLNNGFERSYVLGLVKQMIEAETPKPGGSDLSASILLEYWHQSPLRRHWSSAELLPVLTAAIFKDPLAALMHCGNIMESIGRDETMSLVAEAMASVTNINRLRQDNMLAWLPVDVQLRVVKNVVHAGNNPPGPYYLARLWLKDGLTQPDYGFLRTLFERVTDLPVLYRAITRACKDASPVDPARVALQSLRDHRLKNQSEYRLGVVTIGIHNHPRLGKMRQREVVIGNDRYIHDSRSASLGMPGQDNYTPEEGHLVIFRLPKEPFYRGSDRKYWAVFRPTS